MQAARQIFPDIALDWPAPKVKQPKGDVRQFEFAKFMFIIAIIGAAAFTRVYQQALVAQNGIEIARIRSDIREESRLGKTLKIEKMLLRSPARVERIATAKLGMVKPARVTYIIMPASVAAKSKVRRAERKKKGLDAVLARISFLVK